MNNIALITVIHDIEGKCLRVFNKAKDKFKKLYENVYITVSEETSVKLREELIKNGFKVKIIPKKGAANARREVLKFGLSGGEEYFHYCDFDRILTWIDNYYLELIDIVNSIHHYNYLILGRTPRAFNTHPIEWIETEKITNKIFSIETSLDADITDGSCGFSRECGQCISENSQDKMTDGEWPMIVYRIMEKDISYKAVEGLEYIEDVNGYSKEVKDSDKWFVRLRLSYIISESIMRKRT